jgi:ribosomal protein S18 acetylase RimI-like enzyme
MCADGTEAVGSWTEQVMPWAAVEAFVAAHALPGLPADPLWILAHLVADRSRVIVAGAGRPLAVAALVEAGATASGAAELLLLAAAPGQPDIAASLALVAAAERLVAAAALEVPLVGGMAGAEPALLGRGYAPLFATFAMSADPPFGAPVLPPPAGMAWCDLTAERVEAYDAAVRDAFSGAVGVRVPPIAALAAAALRHRLPIRLLRRGDEVAGFVRIGLAPDGAGRIELLGRRAGHRGRGLGRCILGEGIERLRRAGATRIELEVVATNARALALYRAAGFVVTAETRTLAKRL